MTEEKMGEFEKRIDAIGKILDADIHRELTRAKAQEELKVWSGDEIDDGDIYLTKAQVLKLVEEMWNSFPIKPYMDQHPFGWIKENELLQWFEKWSGRK